MSKCPKCGSEYLGVREDDTCLSCGWYRQTLFDRITASPEVLARSLCGNVRVGCFSGYYSMLTGKHYPDMEKAIAATVARLKETRDGAE